MYKSGILTFALALGALAVQSADAALLRGDFLTTGDGYLVTDTSTNIQWLSPVYTRAHSYNDAFIQNLSTTQHFRYATADEVTDMMGTYFAGAPEDYPGSAAGYDIAANFFSVFGITQQMWCGADPCPRTQGLTSTPGSTGTRLGFGMIQFGSTGWAIHNNPWPETAIDGQMGSWLVRQPEPVPEPGTMALLGIGLSAVVLIRRR
jgi:hypothetical protein